MQIKSSKEVIKPLEETGRREKAGEQEMKQIKRHKLRSLSVGYLLARIYLCRFLPLPVESDKLGVLAHGCDQTCGHVLQDHRWHGKTPWTLSWLDQRTPMQTVHNFQESPWQKMGCPHFIERHWLTLNR
jgi:hypothetical protein